MKNQDHKGSQAGESFKGHQEAIDRALNEKIKSEQGSDKIDPADANDSKKRSYTNDTPAKGTGSGQKKGGGM